MKIIIIEDETPALNRIRKMIGEIDPDIEICGTADSIDSAIELIQRFPDTELALLDIELADGQSFEIFNRIKINFPVIFTTAYDEFALKAFKVNSIDYLLKPIDKTELSEAIHKFRDYNLKPKPQAGINIDALLNSFRKELQPEYKQRFLVKSGQKLVSVLVNDIAYFNASEKLVFLITRENKKFIIDHTLDELSHLLNPKDFFHLNRQFFCSLNSIESISTYFNGKLKISLKPAIEEEVLVSREKASEFKNWLNQ